MLSKIRQAVNSVIHNADLLPQPNLATLYNEKADYLVDKFPYGRPQFLKLTSEEINLVCDHSIRPIIGLRGSQRLPWNSGYAETINGGKSKQNEDQAVVKTLFVNKANSDELELDAGNAKSFVQSTEDELATLMDKDPLPFTYFALFDGHAGTGASLMCSYLMHWIIHKHLCNIKDVLLAKRYGVEMAARKMMTGDANVIGKYMINRSVSFADISDDITCDQLVIGALENAFAELDCHIGEQKIYCNIPGGCTALVALFFLGKLYVANAGDSRGIIANSSGIVAMSNDFTPHSERERLHMFAYEHPECLGNLFTSVQYSRRVTPRDIGQTILCKNGWMKGWTHKTIDEDDMKMPVVTGANKSARLMGTIGVSRGLGDHELQVGRLFIKPFLSHIPEVMIYDICSKKTHSCNDVLIMGTDGLWDILSNDQAAKVVEEHLNKFDASDPTRYVSAAQQLVLHARGTSRSGGSWVTPSHVTGSGDDISVFVIPLHCYGNDQQLQTPSVNSMQCHVTGDGPIVANDREGHVTGDEPMMARSGVCHVMGGSRMMENGEEGHVTGECRIIMKSGEGHVTADDPVRTNGEDHHVNVNGPMRTNGDDGHVTESPMIANLEECHVTANSPMVTNGEEGHVIVDGPTITNGEDGHVMADGPIVSRGGECHVTSGGSVETIFSP